MKEKERGGGMNRERGKKRGRRMDCRYAPPPLLDSALKGLGRKAVFGRVGEIESWRGRSPPRLPRGKDELWSLAQALRPAEGRGRFLRIVADLRRTSRPLHHATLRSIRGRALKVQGRKEEGRPEGGLREGIGGEWRIMAGKKETRISYQGHTRSSYGEFVLSKI
ncbi:uncharacterized protein LOC119593975 [Penaeus monodon]|uniref:uncharacterized protein LOC119593975 n=1 Tax=Penaeus monodon TaxID=6687 RepID=UPI0018A712A3|nr:uncharacterized protein LOC119593975 [Penaeus monodon]